MTSPHPYLLGVWRPSLTAGAVFVNHIKCADQVIQIIPDAPHGYWFMLAVTGDQAQAIRDHGERQKPRWNFLP